MDPDAILAEIRTRCEAVERGGVVYQGARAIEACDRCGEAWPAHYDDCLVGAILALVRTGDPPPLPDDTPAETFRQIAVRDGAVVLPECRACSRRHWAGQRCPAVCATCGTRHYPVEACESHPLFAARGPDV